MPNVRLILVFLAVTSVALCKPDLSSPDNDAETRPVDEEKRGLENLASGLKGVVKTGIGALVGVTKATIKAGTGAVAGTGAAVAEGAAAVTKAGAGLASNIAQGLSNFGDSLAALA